MHPVNEHRTAWDDCWLDDYGDRVFVTEKVQADHDRIRALEAALRDIDDGWETRGLCHDSLVHVVDEMRQCARDALAGKEDER